jgi:hypothetical protein
MKAFLRSLTLVAALCVGWAANAQSLADYTYATGVDATKWVTITDSTNLLGTGNADGRASSLQNIGFTFPFGEDVYTQFSVNSDGNLRLGSTVTGTGAYSTPFNTYANSNNPKINFLGCDGYFLDTIHYVYAENTVDANNDSILAVEFCLGTFTSSTRSQKYKWQIHMYPSGKIEVVMASTAPNNAPATSNQKGLCVNSQDGWIIDSDNIATHFTSGSTVTWPSGSWPAPSTYYTFTRPVITCARPAAITVGNITTTTATVSFTPAGNETEWIGTINPGIMGMTTITLTDTVANLILLAPNTEYTVSVRAICGVGDTSSERSTTFRTLCSALTSLDLPYTEDFEAYGSGSSNPISPCWTKGTNSATAYPYPYSTAAINGTRGLYFYSYKPSSPTGNSYYCYAALPQLSSSLDVTGLTLRFNSKRYSSTSATYRSLIQVGVMTDPTDISTFEMVQLVNMTSLPASTVQFNEIDLANYTGTGKYIAFYAPVVDTDGGSASNYIYIDDVQLVATPTCFRPTNVVVSNPSVSSATVAWTPADPSNINFVVAYSAVGDGLNVITYDTVIGTTATLTGLSQATTYTVKVKAICSATDQSEWSLPTTFATMMIPTPILTHMPYSEGFESPSTWLLANDNTNKWVVGEAINNGGTKSLYISNDGGVSNAYTVSGTQWSYAVKTFSFLSGNVAFSFDWKATGEGNYDYLRAFLVPVNNDFLGGVSPNGAVPYSFRSTNPEGWIPLDGGSKLNLSSSTWMTQMDTVTFDSTSIYNLVFIWVNDASGGAQPPVAIDNLSITVVPDNPCLTPTNVTVSDLTDTSVVVSWTPDETSLPYFGVQIVDPIQSYFFSTVDTFFSITGLTPNTAYAVSVRSFCDTVNAVTSEYSAPVTFYTGYCQPNPTSCDNEGITNVTFGTGTEVVNNSQRPTSAPFYGNYYDMVGAANAGSMLNLNITYATGYTYGTIVWVDWDNSLSFDGDEVVYVGTAPSTNPTVLNAGFVIPGTQDTGVYRMRIAGADSYFDSYTGSIEAAANANPCFTSSYAVAHDYSLHVLPQAACAEPYNVTVSNITAHTATVSWTPADSTQTNYRVRYAIDSLSTYFVTVTGTSTTLTGLYANTAYTVDVMTVCSATDQSNWSTPATFTTACDAIAVTAANPYYETFDANSVTLNCWQNTGEKWFIGTSGAGGHAAYSGNSAFANGTGSGQDILYTPTFDISGYESAVLSFVYINPVWSGDQNELTVSYRNSADSAWNILGVYDYNVGSWTPVSLVIPTVSSTTQIAFNFADDYGYCVGIDSLTLAPVSTYDITIGVSDVTMGTTIPTPGTYAYNPGDTLTITALAASHRHFVQWNDGDTHAVRTIVVSGNATYTAEFDYDSVTIIFANADTAMGTITPVPGVYIYHVGDTINAQAVANTGYHFANWYIGIGTLLDSINNNPLEYVIPAFMAGVEMTITPHYVANMYTINVYANDNTLGIVTGTGNYAYNTTATITATPAAYCTFVEWNDGNTDPVRTVLVTGNASYTAIFQAIPQHNVTVHVAPDANMGTVDGEGLYYENSTVTLTATPNDGYVFVGWAYEGTSSSEWAIISNIPTYSFTMDTADVELYAVFEPAPQPATLTVNFNSYAGHVLINDVQTDIYLGLIGDNVTLQAVANDGFRFVGWSKNGNVFSTDANIILMLTESATEITAIFEQAVGIDDVNASNITIFSTNNNIIVRGAAQQTIRVYDLVGRLVAQRTGSDIEETIAMPASGVYLVQVGNETARRVVVRR